MSQKTMCSAGPQPKLPGYRAGGTPQQGLGILEVLIVLLVIAGGLLALSKIQGGLLSGSSGAKQQAEAGFIGQRVLEDLRVRTWSSADLSPGVHALPSVSGHSAAYSVSYEVTDNSEPSYKTVVAMVTWTDSQGASQTSRITTRLQKSGADGSVRVLQPQGAVVTGSSSNQSSEASSSSSSSTPGKSSKGG